MSPVLSILSLVLAAPPPAASVRADEGGFALSSEDKAYTLKIQGYFHFDGRFFPEDEAASHNDGFVVRRARPIFAGSVGDAIEYRLMTDFGDGKVQLLDAHLDLRLGAGLTLRAGKFKSPVGLERLLSATALPFVERALPTALVPNRDVGLVLSGAHLDGALTWALGVVDGAPDGGSVDGNDSDAFDVVARIFGFPLKGTGAEALRGLGLGVAGTWGQDDATEDFQPTAGVGSYKSAGGQTFFSLRRGDDATATVGGDGARWRVSAQGQYTWARLGLLGEYVRTSHDVVLGDETETLAFTAWQGAATFLLTADAASFEGVRPARPFAFGGEGFGAVELAARVSGLAADDAAFPTYADPAKSARGATAVAGGVNWYLTRAYKVQANYEWAQFDTAPDGEARPDEHYVVGRIQLRF